jgi:hypothetical protein
MSKATGGVESVVVLGGSTYRVHTFTTGGIFTVNATDQFEYLVVAGGGGGGYGRSGNHIGGGGGAGGLRYIAPTTLTAGQSYVVTVGGGGGTFAQGSPSSFSTLTSTTGGGSGGGGGGANGFPGGIQGTSGFPGGSGGGASGGNTGGVGVVGQGFNGGAGSGGGGGGAGAIGGDGVGSVGGSGGVGRQFDINGTSTFYAGGGGSGQGTPGAGGSGGGGTGSNGTTLAAVTGGVNTGGGGGGGCPNNFISGAAGGSGIVIIRYIAFGLAVSSNNRASGETVTFTLYVENTADNTLVPYTITGVDSADINGAPLTGNFTVVNNRATVSFLITTTSKKTLTFSSNGFTQTVAVIENRFGLSVLSSASNLNFTSLLHPSLINLSDRYNLTDITILTVSDEYKFFQQPSDFVTFSSSSEWPRIINLSSSASTASLLNITILQTTDRYRNILQSEGPVLVTGRTFYSVDFVSITNFNVPDPVPLTFQERWAG